VVTNTVNPRPTAALLSFNSVDCNIGPFYTLTNTLTGIGPWTVYWNDGYVQTTNAGLGNAATLIRTVYPTNSFKANVASNNVYFVTVVSNADSCSGNQAGDITGVVTNTVNPRPTAALVSFNMSICNIGTNYVMTNLLTGIGPWTVYWNDGYVQTTNAGLGNSATLIRTVYPTNSYEADTFSNNVYFVTNVSNADTCSGNQPGDITGTNTVTINPRPTVYVTGSTNIYIATTNLVTTVIQASLHGSGSWTVYWSDGYVQAAGTSPAVRIVTNHLAAAVVTTNYTLENYAATNYLTTNSIVGDQQKNSNPHKNQYYLTINGKAYYIIATNAVPAYLSSKSINYTVTNLTDANCMAESVDLTGNALVNLTPRPTAYVYAGDYTNICFGDGTYVQAVLSGTPPMTLTWSDGTSMVVTNPSNPVLYPVFPLTNTIYTITNLVDAVTNAMPADLTGSVSITVNSIPGAPAAISQTNVLGAPVVPFTAVVPAGDLANWYDASGTNLLAGGTLLYPPTNNIPGIYHYFVTDLSSNQCEGASNSVIFTLVPPPPSSPVGATINASVPVYPTLSVSLYTDGANPVGSIVADWYATATGGTALLSNSPSYTPGAVFGTTTFYAQARDLTSGLGLVSLTRTPVTLVVVTNPPCVYSYTTNYTYTTNYAISPTNTELIAFEDLTDHAFTDTQVVTNGYAGLSWINCVAQDVGPAEAGLTAGFGAGDIVGINYGGTPLTITNSLPFDLESGSFVAASHDNLQLEVQGYNGTNLVYDTTNFLSATVATNLVLNCSNVTYVIFISSGGTQNGGYGFDYGNDFAMDNLVVDTNVVVVGIITNSTITTNLVSCPEPDLPQPVGSLEQTNCAGVINSPLVVTSSVPGAVFNWYADATGTNLLAAAANPFLPPTATVAGTYYYYVQTQDTNYLVSSNLTQFTLLVEACTNPPAITYAGTNGVGAIQWYGDLTLQSTPNLLPPVVWKDVYTNGVMSTNVWYWTNGVPPWTNPYYFFRLFTN
jgi:tetrahydromethanopterin S-methyltransferase subunit B